MPGKCSVQRGSHDVLGAFDFVFFVRLVYSTVHYFLGHQSTQSCCMRTLG